MSPSPKPPRHLEISVLNWRQIHTELIWATDGAVEPRFLNTKFFTQNRVVAWLIRRGAVVVDVEGLSATAHEGQWIFPGTKDGWQTFLPGSEILSIRFCAEWETGKTLFDHHDMIVLDADAQPALTRAGKHLQTMVRRHSTEQSPFRFNLALTTVDHYFAIKQAFDNWLCTYIATMLDCGHEPSMMAVADRRVLQAVRLIDNNFPRFSLSEGELARLVGLGVRQLNRLFLSEIGLSPKQYIDRRRLQEAIFLLDYHQRSVKEVAFELGFGSLSHFSVWFARHKDISPRAFQKRHTH